MVPPETPSATLSAAPSQPASPPAIESVTPSVFSEVAAVRYAQLHSPSIYRSQASSERALAERDSMKAELRPYVSVEAEAGRADRLSSNRQDDPADAGIGVFLRHRLFDGKAGWFRYLASVNQSRAAAYEREAEQNRVAAEIRLGFARMRHWYRVATAQRDEVKEMDALSEKLALLAAYGVSTAEKVERLSAQRDNLKVGAEEALSKLQEERRRILELMGAPGGTRLSLGRSNIQASTTDPMLLAGQALQQRAELKAAAYAVEAKRASAESVRRDRYPRADLVLGLATEGRLDESIRRTWETAGRIGIRAEWSPFDFGRNQAKQREEMASLREAEADYAQLKKTVQHDIVNAIESTKLAYNQVQAATSEMVSARKALGLALEAFRNDAGDIETVIRAHRTVRQSRLSESTARYRAEEGNVLLAFSQGQAAHVPGAIDSVQLSATELPAISSGALSTYRPAPVATQPILPQQSPPKAPEAALFMPIVLLP